MKAGGAKLRLLKARLEILERLNRHVSAVANINILNGLNGKGERARERERKILFLRKKDK